MIFDEEEINFGSDYSMINEENAEEYSIDEYNEDENSDSVETIEKL